MHAKLMRLGSRQHLIDRQQPVELRRLDPAVLLDQLALYHADLRDGPAPGLQAETEEAPEQPQLRPGSSLCSSDAAVHFRLARGVCDPQS